MQLVEWKSQLPGVASRARRRGGGRCGFTLVELLVVVAVMGLLLSIVGVGLNSMLGKSPEITGVNQVSAVAGAARVAAMRDARDTAVFFWTSEDGNETLMRIGQLHSSRALDDGPVSPYQLYRFVALDEKPAERLARNVSVGVTAWQVNPDGTGGANQWRSGPFVLWFAPDGTLTTGVEGFSSLAAWLTPQADGTFEESHLSMGASFVGVYRSDLYKALGEDPLPVVFTKQANRFGVIWSENVPGQAKINEWMNRSVRLVVFNHYTGNVFRNQKMEAPKPPAGGP